MQTDQKEQAEVTRSEDAPVIIYGSVRAGTTMFRLMLGAHPDLAEIGENRYLVDCLQQPVGDDLRYDMEQLDMDRVFQMRGLSRQQGQDGADLVASVVEQLRAGRGGPAVLTFHADIAVVDRLFPNARYIHIYRDPRDVANSVTGFGWSGNVYYGADFWLASEQSWEDFKDRIDPGKRLELRYEDLVLDPHEKLRRVCDFLAIPFTEAMLGYNERSNYAKPDKALLTRWKTKLTERQIALVENRCGALMEKRGYSRHIDPPLHLGSLGRKYLALDNKLRKMAATISFYGVQDYTAEKLYRLPMFKNRHADLTRRMHEKVNQSLK